jgi:predicted PurR-regulated permease PerM
MSSRGRRIVAALVIGGLVLAIGWGLWIIRPVLAPFFLAVAVAYLIAPLVNGLARLGLSRGWAILAVYSVLTVLGVLAVGKILPQAIAQTQVLAAAIPEYSMRARQLVDGLQQRVRDMGMPPELRAAVDRSITNFETRSVQALGRVLDIHTLRAAAGAVGSLLLAPFLSFYMLKDIERFKERFVLSLPRRYRNDILRLLRGLDGVLAGFVRGQMLLGLAVGAVAALATAWLGFKYWLLLGIWAGLTEFVPYVGPILGAVPAVLGAFSVSPLLALKTVVAFALIQQVENAVLSPRIMGDSVGLHPLVVMFSVLAGGYLLGGWGLILALPAVGVLRVLWCFLVARLTEVDGRFALAVAAPAARPEPRGDPGQHERGEQ